MAQREIGPGTPDDDHRLLEMRAAGRPTVSSSGTRLAILRQSVRNEEADEEIKA